MDVHCTHITTSENNIKIKHHSMYVRLLCFLMASTFTM